MYRVLSFVAVVLLAAASASSLGDVHVIKAPVIEELSGVKPLDVATGFIAGGEIVGPTDIPYAAGIIVRTDIATRWCGGSLISANWVLSVFSCLIPYVSSVNVLLGTSNMTDTADIIPVAEWVHFYPPTAQNDIALLRLNRPAVLGATVQPVRLPNWRQVQSTFLGQLGTVSGWGSISQSGTETVPLNDLRRAQVPIINNLVCAIRFPGQITDFQICTATELGSPCQGDQGGPLTVADPDGRTTQIGIFSYISVLGCNSGSPAVFTRLTPFLWMIDGYTDVKILDDFEY